MTAFRSIPFINQQTSIQYSMFCFPSEIRDFKLTSLKTDGLKLRGLNFQAVKQLVVSLCSWLLGTSWCLSSTLASVWTLSPRNCCTSVALTNFGCRCRSPKGYDFPGATSLFWTKHNFQKFGLSSSGKYHGLQLTVSFQQFPKQQVISVKELGFRNSSPFLEA